ncbi:hypothetical protein [Polyangium spumosum]|uniref:Secreted protein n=1 Tax=Polyangium spumosum TaxID=889282 RepID=A0A6N7PHQ8_9BACT|nr:hypothetical protein [Polyangium spumosum]MRG91508.1 hypothetical protein [Polyangium spumosum]
MNMVRFFLLVSALSLTGCVSLLAQIGGGSSDSGGASDKPKDAPAAPGDGDYADPGAWEGPLHQKYAGKVVFSSKPIPKDGADDSSVYTAYTLGGPLYGRFWSKESPHNLMPKCSDPRHIMRVDVNGEHAGKPPSQVPSFDLAKFSANKTRTMASLTGELEVPFTTASTVTFTKADGDTRAIRDFNALVVPKLKEGDNTVRVIVSLDCGASRDTDPLVAEGTLEVKVEPGAKKEYLTKYGAQLAPSQHPENTKLAPQIVKLVDDKPDWDNEVVLGARVISDQWEPVRNKITGVLTHHVIEAAVVVRLKKETDENACRVFPIGVTRDAAGGSIRWGGNGSGIPFPCVNAPK